MTEQSLAEAIFFAALKSAAATLRSEHIMAAKICGCARAPPK
jgi:hypothetical protein